MKTPEKILTFGALEEDMPLSQRIVLRGSVASFESRAPGSKAGLDVEFLSSLPKTRCWYGACDCDLYPFISASAEPFTTLPTGARVLRELCASRFSSAHIPTLERVSLPYPGYHPMSPNDEIHTERDKQSIFARTENEEANPSTMAERSASAQWHEQLARYVVGGHLYYVLLHTKPHVYGDYSYSEWVILFAVGVSPRSGYLVGAVTSQACHNYCD